MASPGIQRLLKELQASQIRSPRSGDRKPFVRPVRVEPRASNGNTLPRCEGFSRDMSGQGLAMVSAVRWPEKTIATLAVHSLTGGPVNITSEARWSEPYGDGWYLTGWIFLREGQR